MRGMGVEAGVGVGFDAGALVLVGGWLATRPGGGEPSAVNSADCSFTVLGTLRAGASWVILLLLMAESFRLICKTGDFRPARHGEVAA